MKKYLDEILLGCAAFFAALTLILMNAPGLTGSADFVIAKVTYNPSVYDLVGNNGDTTVGLVFAVIFVVLCLVAAACLLVLKLIKFKFSLSGIVALAAAVLSLIAGILYFCTKGLVGSSASLGAGAVFCGIFSLLNAGVFGFYGVTKLK